MAADGDLGADRVLRQGQAAATVAPLHELTEALTALGNYLAAANKIYDRTASASPLLGKALEKSLRQHERAVEATRRLHELHRPRRKVEGDCLIGFR